MSTQDTPAQQAAAAAAARPASAPLHGRPATSTDCWRVVQPTSVDSVGVRELDVVSYSRDEVDVCREMVLVSLIEGSVRSSGVRAVLYKCHMCGGFVSSLGGLTRHMATHGSARPATADDLQQRHRLKTAAVPASTPLEDSAASCNGHVDSIGEYSQIFYVAYIG